MRRLQLLQKIFILYWLLTVFSLSCRKLDIISSSKTPTAEEKFFSNHRSLHKDEEALVNFLKRTNEKHPFIQATVGKIGFPVWDKLIKQTVKTNHKTAEAGEIQVRPMANTASCDIYYVPFVRDSQNHVNAAMIIKAFSADTTIGYVCDWQYKSLLTVPDNHKVEKFALFFMRFDYSVFGHKRFMITDKTIFPARGNSVPEEMRLELKNEEQKKVKVNSLYTTCQDYSVEYISCPYIRNYGECYGPGGTCDRCSSCPSVTLYFTECWDEWVDDDMGGGSSGGDTGGGGTVPPSDPCSGDGTPPQGPEAIRNITQSQEKVAPASPPPPPPCDPGWEPEPEPQPIPDPPLDTTGTPCATAWAMAVKLNVLYDSSKAAQKLESIDVAHATLEHGFTLGETIRINPYNALDTGSYGFFTGDIVTGTDSSITLEFLYNPNIKALAGTLHTHPAKGYSAQSAKDIYELIGSRLEPKSRIQGNFVGAANGSVYAVAVTDATKAAAFYNTKDQNMSGSKWREGTPIAKAFEDAINYYEKQYRHDPQGDNISYGMAMAAVLSEYNTGVTLYKQNLNGKFVPLTVRTNKNEKGRRTGYSMDCGEE